VALDNALAAAQVAPHHEGIRRLVAELRHDIETDDAHPFELTGEPFVEVSEPVPPPAMFAVTAASMTAAVTTASSQPAAPTTIPPPGATRQNAGALAQLNQWASSLLRRHSNR